MVAAVPTYTRSMGDHGLTPSFLAPRERIDAHLASTVDSLDTPDPLREAVRYALLGGGKRLRPLLAWHCCVATSGDADSGSVSLPAGAAVELVHAFSLVHDDLPAMDDDDMRRGRPTLHVHAGEAMAILAGDAMLALAFGVLSAPAEDRPAYEPALRCRLVEELTRGTSGMIAGQVLDT
ncbi:MAG: polyprenyl synthetase family protein, partial [Phycisphaerales bacterium]|nr:polyprenyl synthetase family protein [Phycisphaerales bacterium]